MRVVAYVAALMLSLFGCEEAPSRGSAAATQATPSPAAAGITVLKETETSLSMRFTDAANHIEVFTFSRPDANAVWTSADPRAGRGIRFGTDAPVFASVRFLASRNIPVLCSLVTFDSSIADAPMEDITVFELSSGTVVIGLWNHGKITHIAWVGTLIQHVVLNLAAYTNPMPDCQIMKEACCGELANPAGGTFPPDLAACEAVADGGCPAAQEESVCNCLHALCAGPPPSVPACIIENDHCVQDPDPEPDPIEDMFQHILNLLTELHEILECEAGGGQWVEGECVPGPAVAVECW